MHKIQYSSEFDKDYKKLKEKAEKGSMEAQYLIGLIGRATQKLSENPEAGTQVQRKIWPREYARKYDLTNLWKFNLDRNWRLTYTLTGSQIELFLIYLECMKHKEYDRKFKYRKT